MQTFIFACGLLFAFAQKSVAQSAPQAVDLGIENVVQLQDKWCWAAASEQIIWWLTGNDVPQCELVATAFNSAAQTGICCNYPYTCNLPGQISQIQSLILAYGGHYSTSGRPGTPMEVYQTLTRGRAIIMQLNTSPTIGHIVVIRGMEWQYGPYGFQPVFFINDPMQRYTTPVYFSQLARIWGSAIVVY